MTTEDFARVLKAHDMLSDWVGIQYIWWPDSDESEFWNDSACILQQLIAEYEGWT